MIPCELIQDELKAYLDGQLPFMMRQRVRWHLRRCAACREELSAMEQISNRLRADRPTPIEPSLRAKILAAASKLGPLAQDASSPPTKWRRKPILIWAATAVALIAWFALYPVLNNGGALQHMPGVPQANRPETPMATGFPAAASPPVIVQSGGQQGMAQRKMMMTSMAKAHGMSVDPKTGRPKPDNTLQDYDEAYSRQDKTASSPSSMEVSNSYFQNHKMGDTGITEDRTRYEQAGAANATNPLASYEFNHPANAVPGNSNRVPSGASMSMSKTLIDGNTRLTPARPFSDHRAVGGASALSSVEAAGEDERIVHHEAGITVQVDNVEAKSEAVEQLTQGAGGYVADNQLSTGDDNARTASLTLKVPVAQFQNVLNQVARQGDVKAKNISGQDLTEEVSDQEQAEQTLRSDVRSTQEELNQRLSKAGRAERLDILRELRIKLAQKQARLKLLRKLGALSTISVELDEKPHQAPQPAPKVGGFVGQMNDTLHDAVSSMLQAARLPILTFIWILAYAPLWILLILGYRWTVKR